MNEYRILYATNATSLTKKKKKQWRANGMANTIEFVRNRNMSYLAAL